MSTPQAIESHGPAVSEAADNRRSSPRYAIQIGITLCGDNNFYMGLSENLSEGGVFIATQTVLEIGTVVRLQFSISTEDAGPITVVGVVRWLRGQNAMAQDHNMFTSTEESHLRPGIGIQFAEVSPADEAKIREFFSLRRPDFYDD